MTTHRLVASPDALMSLCRNSKPGDTIAAQPMPLTCPECILIEATTVSGTARNPWALWMDAKRKLDMYEAALRAIGDTKEYELTPGHKKLLCCACGWDVEMCNANIELGAKCSGQLARAALR